MRKGEAGGESEKKWKARQDREGLGGKKETAQPWKVRESHSLVLQLKGAVEKSVRGGDDKTGPKLSGLGGDEANCPLSRSLFSSSLSLFSSSLSLFSSSPRLSSWQRPTQYCCLGKHLFHEDSFSSGRRFLVCRKCFHFYRPFQLVLDISTPAGAS